MKHITLKLLAGLIALSTLSLSAHTYRFCNLGTAAVTVIPDLWGLSSNPDPVTIQPGQSYDFSTSRDMKGACFSSNPSEVTSCGDDEENFTRSSHSSSNTMNLSQTATDGTWFLTSLDKLVNCATPMPQQTKSDSSSSSSDGSSDSSSSGSTTGSSTDGSTTDSTTTGTTSGDQSSQDLSSTLSSWTSSDSGTTSTAGSTANCVCTVGGQANQQPPSGVSFVNGDCTQPTMGGVSASAILSCAAAPATATPNCSCTVNGQANQPPPSGVEFANSDCTQPTMGGLPISSLITCAASGASSTGSTTSETGSTSSDESASTDSTSSSSSTSNTSTSGTSGFPSGFGS